MLCCELFGTLKERSYILGIGIDCRCLVVGKLVISDGASIMLVVGLGWVVRWMGWLVAKLMG